jgi:hypothetical protein
MMNLHLISKFFFGAVRTAVYLTASVLSFLLAPCYDIAVWLDNSSDQWLYRAEVTRGFRHFSRMGIAYLEIFGILLLLPFVYLQNWSQLIADNLEEEMKDPL